MNSPSPGLFRAPDGRNLAFTFALVSSLFFLWGFCNGMIDVMDKHFQEELNLTLAQSAWVQFAHYFGYFLMAIPAGWLARKLGYKGGIIAGLLIVALGGFWFVPATQIAQFWAFLLGVCLIAAGLTFLETVANPYTTVLGPDRYAATRINLAQSCNGIGWILGPIVGGIYFYGQDSAGQSTGSQTLWIPYAAVAVVVLILAVVFFFAPLPEIETKSDLPAGEGTGHTIWQRPHFVVAVAAQFFYVAAQAGIFSFFINYMTTEVPVIPTTWQSDWTAGWFNPLQGGALTLSNQGAAFLASVGFFFFLAGRFSGAVILKRFAAHRVLGLYGALAGFACVLVVLNIGWISVAAVFAAYFLMSIMFPTIFALGIHGLGPDAKKASAYLVMAIMGGAIVPKIMGAVGDHYGMARSFLVPLVCFAVVAFYGFAWARLSGSSSATIRPHQGAH